MRRFGKGIGLGVFLVVTAAIVAGCSPGLTPGSSLGAPRNGLVQSSSVGAVAIEVKWGGEENGSLVFEVAMDTHSVDLDQYDLGRLVVLQDDEGQEYRPTAWRSAPGGHHTSGTLIFPLPPSLSQGKAGYLQLVIRDVAGVKERVLRWELG